MDYFGLIVTAAFSGFFLGAALGTSLKKQWEAWALVVVGVGILICVLVKASS